MPRSGDLRAATQPVFSVELTILRETLLMAISPRPERFHPRERGAVSRGI